MMQFKIFEFTLAPAMLLLLLPMLACHQQSVDESVAKAEVATTEVKSPLKNVNSGQSVQTPASSNEAVQEPFNESLSTTPVPPTFKRIEWPGDAQIPHGKLEDKPSFELPIMGKWNGAFYKYAYFRTIQLDLKWKDRVSGTIKGTATLQKWVRKRRGPSRFEHQGSGTVEGSFDSATRELNITIGDFGSDNRDLGRTIYSLKGVLAESPLEFAGEIFDTRSNRQTDRSKVRFYGPLGSGFVLSKQFDEKTPLIDRVSVLNGLREKSSAEKVDDNGKLKDVPPEQLLAKIEQWTRRLENEYTKKELKDGRKALFLRSINLFEDEHFSSHFGVPFDQLPDVDSVLLGRLIYRATTRREFGDQWRDKLKSYSGFQRTFGMVGDYSRVDTISHIWPRRIIRRWKKQSYQSMADAPVYSRQTTDVDRLRKADSRWSKQLFPSENNDEKFSTLYKKIGPSVADGYIAELVGAPPSMETLNKLRNWHVDTSLKNFGLKGTNFSNYRELIDKRFKFILAQLVQSNVDAMAALENESGSSAEYCRLQQEMLQQFSQYRFSPPIEEAVQYSRELRAAVLKRQWETIETKIAACTKPEEITKLKGAVLQFPEGIEATTLAIASKAFDTKLDAINRPYFESLFSKRELALMGEGNSLQIPASPVSPPTDHEIKLAIVREYAAAIPSGRKTAADTYDYVVALLNIPGKKTQVRIVAVEQIGKAEKLENAKFRVKFRYSTRTRYMFLERDKFVTNMQNQLAKQADGVFLEPVEETFVLTQSGWRSPSINKAVNSNGLVVKGKAVRAMGVEFDPKFKSFIDAKFPAR